MIKSTNRRVFAEDLSIAVIADEVASSLRHISERKRLEDRDRRVIGMADKLLREILRGRDATKNKRVEDSLEASLAYGQAIQAVQLKPAKFSSFKSFERLLDFLSGRLKEIEAERTFDVDDLYEFFTAIRELSMASGARNRKFESVSVSGIE